MTKVKKMVLGFLSSRAKMAVPGRRAQKMEFEEFLKRPIGEKVIFVWFSGVISLLTILRKGDFFSQDGYFAYCGKDTRVLLGREAIERGLYPLKKNNNAWIAYKAQEKEKLLKELSLVADLLANGLVAQAMENAKIAVSHKEEFKRLVLEVEATEREKEASEI
jgi:hypothetical protein